MVKYVHMTWMQTDPVDDYNLINDNILSLFCLQCYNKIEIWFDFGTLISYLRKNLL